MKARPSVMLAHALSPSFPCLPQESLGPQLAGEASSCTDLSSCAPSHRPSHPRGLLRIRLTAALTILRVRSRSPRSPTGAEVNLACIPARLPCATLRETRISSLNKHCRVPTVVPGPVLRILEGEKRVYKPCCQGASRLEEEILTESSH